MEMKNRFQEAIQNVQRQRHLARRSVAMVLVLAMLTAMSVSWRLHQDGIALAADDTRYYCGKEEHKHTDDCYIEGTEPICGYEEGEIVEETMDLADDAGDGDSRVADWDEAGSEPESEPATQEEPEPEVVLHHHTSDCYEEKEVLTCGIESDHVHQDYCYDQETGELLCTEHEHTDDCYTLEEVLVCGQEEGEPEKTDDGAALYDMDENSAEESDFAGESETVADPEPEKEATKPETDDEIDTGYTVHHHTAECYGKVLICGKEEHEHTAACLVNPNAEIDAEYDAKTPDRTDADWAQDMVLVARSQLGYTESKADVDEDGNGYTMYADQYYKDKPMVYADWDSTFVAYCLYHAGVPQDIIPQYASISALRGELARMNSEYYTDDPQGFASILPGDIVMYKNAEGRETIGVVSDAAVDEETDLTTALTVISGDVATGYESDGETTIDQVAEVEVALNDVTSVVSVNAAYGYDVDDMVEGDTQTAGQELSGTPLELNEKNTENLTINVKHTDSSGTDNELVFEDGDKITVSGSFSVSTKKLKDARTNTVRWNTELKLPERVEHDIILGGEVYGKYTVSENGVVDFVFNEKAMKLADIKVEDFGFDAEFFLNDNSNEKEIQYPGMTGTITLKRKSDIKVKKSSEQNGYVLYTEDGKPYIHFEVTVSTEKGTAGKTLLIQDTIAHTAIKGDYNKNSFKLQKVSEGTATDLPLPAGQPEFGKDNQSDETPTFTVKDLPALKAGEKYVLSYDYYIDLDKCDNKTLLGVVQNNVTAQAKNGPNDDSGPKAEDSWKTEFKTSITKTSRYDSNTNRIVWTIIVRNPEDGNDLNGYTVTDALETGTTAEITGKIYRYGGNKEDTSDNRVSFEPNEDKKGFTYTFPAESTQKFYRFVYNTSAPAGETVKNNVTYKDRNGNEEKTSGTGSAGTRISGMVVKAPSNGSQALTDTNSNRIKKAGWWATIVPSADTKIVEFTDTFQQPMDGSGNPAVGAEHYALQNELRSELKAKIEIYLTDADDGWYGDGNATARRVNITYTFYDAKGNVIPDGDNTTHVRSFKVRVDATNASVGNVWKINLGRDSNRYYTYVDLTGMQNGKDWTIQNQITSDQVTPPDKSTSTAYYPYKKNKETVFEKTVFDKGDQLLGRSDTITYGNQIWYQLWIVPEDGADTITIRDTLEKGLKFDDSNNNGNANYCAALRQNSQKTKGRNNWPSSNELTELTKNISITASGTSEDGQVLNIQLTGLKAAMEAAENANKPFDGVAIMYRVQVDDPDFWSIYENTDKPYANHAKWIEGGKEDTATVTVSRNETYLEKSGEQEKNTSGLNTERVTYTIDINKTRANLNPSKDKIKLTDRFTTVKNATAALESATVKKIEQNGTETEVPESDYRLETSAQPSGSEKTEYEIVLTVDDATHYKFTYTYKIDTSEVKDSDFPLKLENTASIVGKWTDSDKVSYYKVNGWVKLSADGVLKIRKVEKGKEQTTLRGAEFTLYRYENGDWKLFKKNITPQNGEITYTPSTSSSCIVSNFGAHKLMKLVETKAPDGYTRDATPLYFIWRTDKDPSDSSLAPGKQKDIFKAAIGSNADSVQDGDTTVNYDEVTYYGYGKTYEQTIRNAKQQIVLQKVWKDEAGHILAAAPDDISSIDVTVYQIDSTGKETKQGEYTLSASDVDGWTKTISVQAGYTYRVEENNIQSGYSVTYTRNFNDNDVMKNGSGYVDGDTARIVNRKLPTSLKVKKLWKDPDGNYKTADLPESITLQLYTIGEDGQKTEVKNATITLPQDGKWEYTFTNLDPTAHYVVEEASVSGYTVSYTYPEGSGETTGTLPGATVTITNTEAPTYELPSTGSPGGTVPYTAGGAAIALAAVLCGYNSRRKRKRGEE